jgi:uncharacterized membrane protein
MTYPVGITEEEKMIENTHTQAPSPLWKRVLWLVTIYAGSVLALGCVATVFRFMMTAAGMRSH